MKTIVHISDTHFGTEIPIVIQAIVQMITRIDPDIIILSGDITQRATNEQFKAAADFLASLPAKIVKLVVPGNHDIPLFNAFMRLAFPYANYKAHFGEQEHVWIDDEVAILCYDSTSPLRHTRGKLTRQQVLKSFQKLRLMSSPSLVIACAHQPLVTAWSEDVDETLIGRDNTAQLWSENNVDIALSGHVHVPLLTTTHSAFPNIKRHFILAGAGTAVSHRVRPGAPNSFNVIRAESRGKKKSISVTPYTLNADYLTFTAAAEVKYINTPTGWR